MSKADALVFGILVGGVMGATFEFVWTWLGGC